MGQTNTQLTAFENAVLDEFVSIYQSHIPQLHSQVRSATAAARERTGAGFYLTLKVAQPTLIIDEKIKVLDGISANINGLDRGAGFTLFVQNGKIHLLEGFSFGEPWPENVGEFEISSAISKKLSPHSRECNEPTE